MRPSSFLLAASLFTSTLAATAGCGRAPSSLKEGVNSVTINGKQRDWILTLPPNYNNAVPHRLILGLHWRNGTYQDVANGGYIKPYYGLPELANGTAIFVAPNGLTSDATTGWPNTDNEDIDFMRTIVDATDADLCIDPALRFALGYSYGGGMSHSIACSLGTHFRGVAVLSGALISGCADSSVPVAWYGQHGVSDETLPIALGRAIRNTFVQRNGCTPQTPEEPAPGSKARVVTKYSGCVADKPVWWTAFDGPHTPIPAAGAQDKERTFTGDAVWEFFEQFT